jgi:hypothetical protein
LFSGLAYSSIRRRAIALVFLLQAEPLEVLRAAFKTLDVALAEVELKEQTSAIARRRIEEYAKPENKDRPVERVKERDRYYSDLLLAAYANSHPLEAHVIHHARCMPDAEDGDPNHARPRALHFVCGEWISSGASAHSVEAKEWLLTSFRAAGAKIHDPLRHYAKDNEPVHSGWRSLRRGMWSDALPPAATPLPMEVQPRFRRLMAMFRAYTQLMVEAAFRAHREYYGEVCTVEADAKEDGPDDQPRPPKRFIRRFTRAAFTSWMRDLALQDSASTESLLIQSVLTVHGAMPHPMHIYNVAHATFQ